MSDIDLNDAVAQETGEDSRKVRRRGFTLAGRDDAGSDHDPECLFPRRHPPETARPAEAPQLVCSIAIMSSAGWLPITSNGSMGSRRSPHTNTTR
jgi:hypothetical protein